MKYCPKCGEVYPDSASFCKRCGAELEEDGGVFRTEPDEEEETIALWQRGLIYFFELFPGLARPTVILAAAATFVLAAVAISLGFFLLTLHVIFASFAIGAGGVMLYWTALSWLLYGYICLPVEAMSEFEGKHWTVLFLASILPVTAFFWYAKTQLGQ
ncbi:MAG: zinc-ribbon domain-containing protein [Candidatus Brocadiia bacterium]